MIEAADTATQSIIRSRLDSVTREMAWVLSRTAFSPILWNGQDFSCALIDADGRLLTLATKVPLHIVAMVQEVKELRDRFPDNIREGDLFLQNDPYLGGTHLPDVNLILPVFVKGTLAYFSCARAHWGDVGGMTPGSISGTVTSIYQEGLRFSLARIGRNFEVDASWKQLLASNTRGSEQRLGDLEAQLAACRTGATRLTAMAERYGPEVLSEAIQAILEATEEHYRRQLAMLPDGAYVMEDYLDNDGVSNEAVRLRATVDIGGKGVTVDFSGTSPQSKGPINCSKAAATTTSSVALKAALDPTGPVNDGLLRIIDVIAPPDTVVNASYPAPTGGFTEVLYAMTNVVCGALAQASPARLGAADTKSANHHFIGISTGSPYYDYPPGGCGATAVNDGMDFTKSMASGVLFSQAIETVERDGHLKFRRHELRADSGGAGKYRGGRGVRREIEILAPEVQISILGDGALIPPFGLAGGSAGAVSRWQLLRDDRAEFLSAFGAKVSGVDALRGDRLIIETAGGGGFGDPRTRDPELVAEEIREGLLTEEGALIYQRGPVGSINVTIEKSQHRSSPRGVRRLGVPEGTGLPNGALAEVRVAQNPSPLRVCLHTDTLLPGTASLDEEGMHVLRVKGGEEVQIRVLTLKRGVE